MNGLTLAYIGDAYYETMIRIHVINKGYRHVNKLHNLAVGFTAGSAQATIIEYFIKNEMLSLDELAIFKRGRNSSGSGRKNIDGKTYSLSTGFEALIGHLYLNDIKRCDELINEAISYIEREEL